MRIGPRVPSARTIVRRSLPRASFPGRSTFRPSSVRLYVGSDAIRRARDSVAKPKRTRSRGRFGVLRRKGPKPTGDGD